MPHLLPSNSGERAALRPVPSAAPSLGAPAPRPAGYDDGPDWRRLFAAISRYRWYILGATVVGALLGVGASRFVSPQYRARANIWIDESGPQQQQGAAPGPFQASWNVDPQAWVDLLRSYVVLDSVVRELHLYVGVKSAADASALADLGVSRTFQPGDYRLTVSGGRYTLAVATGKRARIETGAVGDSVGRAVGFLWAPGPAVLWPGRTLRFSITTPRDAANRLGQALDVQIDQQGNFLKLGLDGPDPKRVATILNAVAQRYVTVAAELKRQKISQIAGILGAQAGAAQQRLSQAEQALEGFQVRTATLPSDRAPATPAARAAGATGEAATAVTDPANGGYLALVAQRDQADQDREALRRLLATTPDSELGDALEAMPAAMHYPALAGAIHDLVARQDTLRRLSERYTADYPPVQAVNASIAVIERQTIPPLVRQVEHDLASRASGLAQSVDAAATTLRTMPSRDLEQTRLVRSVDLADNLYSTLEQRYDEAQIAQESSVPSVRILDEAVAPQRPLKDLTPRILLFAIFGSFLLAVFGAVVVDRLDPRFRYPEQVSRDLGLPILGTVPHLSRGNGGAGVRLEDAAAFIEALRGIRMNVLSELNGDGPVMVAISSPGPGDGKSFLSANLARVFAEAGRRTLLVDADIRRGLQHRRFAASRQPGLSDFLRGEAALPAVIRPTQYQNLDLIGCGTRVHDAPELLGTPLMERLIAEARASYDVVLCDCPPLSAGVDPFVVAAATGNMLLIVRTGVSRRELTQTKLEVVGRMRIQLRGAVLNDVPAGFVYGGYSYYLPGYEGADERAARRPRPSPVI